jgi:hypothetical protein
MASGSFETNHTTAVSTETPNHLIVSWSSTPDTAKNQSIVYWSVIGGSDGTSTGKWTAVRNVHLTINGTTYEILSAGDRVEMKKGMVLGSGSTVVAHNDDGTKSVSVSLTANVYIGSASAPNCTYYGTITLDTIPRSSTLTIANGTLGVEQTLTIGRYVSTYTHSIGYSATSGGTLTEIVPKSSSLSVSWTPPLDTAANAPSSQSVTLYVTIETFNGSTPVGSREYPVSFAIPSSVRPSVSVAVSDVTGHFSTFGACVQGYSKLGITLTPSLAYGSPIQTYVVTADGKSYNEATVTTPPLSGKGTLVIKGAVTDKRQRTSVEVTDVSTNSITVLEYAPPVVTASAYRCDSAGTKNDEGSHMKIAFSATITSLNGKNTANYTVRYKADGTSTWTTVMGTGTSYTSAAIACTSSSAWNVEVVISDKLSSTTKAMNIPIAFTLMDFYNTGAGVSLGKIATRDGFDCAMTPYFGNQRLQEVAAPTASTDAVNLAYLVANYGPTKADEAYPSCYYRTVDDVKEWINPPMASDIEYRTIERWMGKPVYTKIVPFGSLPNNDSRYINWYPDSGTVSSVISAVAVASGGSMLNVVDSANPATIWIITDGDYSSQTANVVLKYTKM